MIISHAISFSSENYFLFRQIAYPLFQIFLDDALICPYNDEKDACGVKNNVVCEKIYFQTDMQEIMIRLRVAMKIRVMILFFIILFGQQEISYAEDNITLPSVSPPSKLSNCSLQSLSETNVECWNMLFGEFFYFKGIVSFEVTDLSGRNDIAVIFTALGHPVEIPRYTLILPEGSPYAEGKDTKFNHIEDDEEKVLNKVIYGLIMLSPSSGKNELKMYGEANIYEYDESCDTIYDVTDYLKGNGIKRFCINMPSDELPAFKTKCIFPKKPPFIIYSFVEGGDSADINDALFIFQDNKITPLFNVHHSKDDRSMIEFGEGKIIEQVALHTPFEPEQLDFGHRYFYSFTVKTAYTLKNDKFIIADETIEPTSIKIGDGDNLKAKGTMFMHFAPPPDDEEKLSKAREIKLINKVLKKQKMYKQGKNKWLGDPIAFVRHTCKKCTNIRKAFHKNGVSVIWADLKKSGVSRHISYYLYQPLYEYKGVGKISIWQEAEINETYLSALLEFSFHDENGNMETKRTTIKSTQQKNRGDK